MQTTTLPHENSAKGSLQPSQYKSKSFPLLWRTAFFSGGESAKMLSAFVQTVSSCAHTSHSFEKGFARTPLCVGERACKYCRPLCVAEQCSSQPVYLLPMDVHSSVPAGPLPHSPPVVQAPPGGPNASCSCGFSSPCALSTGAFGKETELCPRGKADNVNWHAILFKCVGSRRNCHSRKEAPCLILNVLPTSHCSTITSSPSLLPWCTFCEARGD